MSQSKHKQTAFTLVELMMASLAGAIVLVGAGFILLGGQQSWNQAWKRMNLQRDAAIALQAMTTQARPATSMEIDDEGRWVTLHQGEDWVKFTWNASDGNLLKQTSDSEEAQVLVDAIVTEAAFAQQGGLLSFTLTLESDEMETQLATSVRLRNSGT